MDLSYTFPKCGHPLQIMWTSVTNNFKYHNSYPKFKMCKLVILPVSNVIFTYKMKGIWLAQQILVVFGYGTETWHDLWGVHHFQDLGH